MMVIYRGKLIDIENVYELLANNGITGTTGYSEAFDDGWVLYQGDNGFRILVKEKR